MVEIYNKFYEELKDIRVTGEIRTFNSEDLKKYLMENTHLEKSVVRKEIRKKISKNKRLEKQHNTLSIILEDFDEASIQLELDSLLKGYELTEMLENEELLLGKCVEVKKMHRIIEDNELQSYLLEKKIFFGSLFKSIYTDIQSADDVYNSKFTMLDLKQYLDQISRYALQLSDLYDQDFYTPYKEEDEQFIINLMQKLESYSVLKELEEIVKSEKTINGYLSSKYDINDKDLNNLNKRIQVNRYVVEKLEYLESAIRETLFDAEHSNLLSEYVTTYLTKNKGMLEKLKEVYKNRTMEYEEVKIQLDKISTDVLSIVEKYKAINRIERDYLPTIKEDSKNMLEDVDSYYNFSLKKNIERRKGEFGFSKEITVEEVETMVSIIEKKLYKLTGDQRMAIEKAAEYMNYSYTTNCLLQGDVSSGKTIVSVALMFMMAKKGYKSAYVVPRGSLRIQHLNTLKKYNELFDLNLKIVDAKTTSDLSKADIILNGYSFNDIKFNSITIDMAFIDEIQLLGVKQRNSIQDKYENIDMFYTTATPHPRTKTISLIGDMDVIEIRELPPGRKPKVTEAFTNSNQLLMEKRALITETFDKNEMMIVVCPLINKESDDIGNVHTAFEIFKEAFPGRKVIKMLAGEERIPSNENSSMSKMDEKLQACSKGDIDILVTTKIVEVGVDIPRASIILIASSDGSFGYGVSTLHQLRGRVGRAQQQAYCFIQTPKGVKEGSAIHTVLETEDVFEITEKDLDWRGIDKIIGLKQTADSPKKDHKRLVEAYKHIAEVVKEAIANLSEDMFNELCREVDTSERIKDIN